MEEVAIGAQHFFEIACGGDQVVEAGLHAEVGAEHGGGVGIGEWVIAFDDEVRDTEAGGDGGGGRGRGERRGGSGWKTFTGCISISRFSRFSRSRERAQRERHSERKQERAQSAHARFSPVVVVKQVFCNV